MKKQKKAALKKPRQTTVLIGAIVIIGIAAALFFAFRGQQPQSQSTGTVAQKQENETNGPAVTYFATVNSAAASEKSISIYTLDGTQVKKIPYPAKGITKAAGDALYLGSDANSQMNVIASLSPQTSAFANLDFTNTADAIFGWDVSQDHSHIAWIDTDKHLHISNLDGTKLESHQLPNTNPTGPAPGWATVQFSTDGQSILASTVGSRNIWRADKKSFDPLPESDDQIFSPSLKFGAPLYDSEGAIVITDTSSGASSTVFVEPPDSYVALSPDSSCSFAPSTSVVAFSPDESQLLLKVGAPCDGEKSETFIAYIDGGITRPLLKGYSPLAYLDQGTIMVKKDDGTLAIASTDDGKILKELSDQTEYLGMMRTGGF